MFQIRVADATLRKGRGRDQNGGRRCSMIKGNKYTTGGIRARFQPLLVDERST